MTAVRKKRKSSLTLKGFWRIALPPLVVAAATVIFMMRYQPAFSQANFYAEDGNVFTNTVLTHNPVETALTGFNGYLVVGQYIIAEAAVDAASALGMHFYQIPAVIAFFSCLFLGLTVALPYILFRRQLGQIMALVAVLFGAFTPMPSSDYVVIGTLGNLKFAFLYWAFLFVLYRIQNVKNTKKVVLSDAVLLLSILTYAPAAALLPFALWPYKDSILKAVRSKKDMYKLFRTRTFTSLIVLSGISAVYLSVVILRGVPPIPGYLDGPYHARATMKIAFHSTWYAWLFVLVDKMRDLVAAGLIALVIYIGLRFKNNREVFLLGAWSILVGTVSFVVNRPGIGDFFMQYANGPDQFFYAQRLVFTFMIIWMFAAYFKALTAEGKTVYLAVIILLFLCVVRYAGSFGANQSQYSAILPANKTIPEQCANTHNSTIVVGLYPSQQWHWTLDRNTACK